MAIRPKTLPAGAMPVVLASALAFANGGFALLPALAALVCAVLMQIASNLINDLYDFRKGADTGERLGPPRAVASGALSEEAVKRAAWIIVLAAFVLGQYLVWIGGWQIFTIGIVSLVAAWAYTGGPKPLAYIGLGEVCAFVFFGIVPVCGTYYVQTHEWSLLALAYSLVPAFWAANILLVNNVRDITTDRTAGKLTLAVRIGGGAARGLYCAMSACAFAVPCALAFQASATASGNAFGTVQHNYWLFGTLLALPLAFTAARDAFRLEGASLNVLLMQTVRLLIVHCLLLSLGVCASLFYHF
jgi:1,4-dihydroxy-2-naphthoate polyprenyltransferase